MRRSGRENCSAPIPVLEETLALPCKQTSTIDWLMAGQADGRHDAADPADRTSNSGGIPNFLSPAGNASIPKHSGLSPTTRKQRRSGDPPVDRGVRDVRQRHFRLETGMFIDGADVLGGTPADMGQLYAAEHEWLSRVLRDANIRLKEGRTPVGASLAS